jgi:hypothetical protein
LRIELSKGYFNNLADLEGTTSIPVGPWIHVAATFDSNSVRLYFDGVEDAVSTALGSIDSSSADLFVGALGAGMGEYFDGSIDDVCIFNRALVETEIQALRNWRGGIVSPWLSIKPITGTVPPHGSIPIQVTFDASGMQPGMYGTEIAVRSNDPVMPSVSVPVTMTVLPTANMGWVEGTVTDARTGDPLQATVITLDQPYTVTTDPVTGHYILWLDEGNYTLQVSAAGYVTATAVVDIVAQEGATQGFALASIGTRTSYLPLAWKNTE